MLRLFKNFLKEEEGMGTVEIVVIIAVLVSIALIFRKSIITFVQESLSSIFGGADVDITSSGGYSGTGA